MRIIRAINKFLVRVETALLVVFLGTMVMLAFGQVVLRNAFGTSFLWGDTLVRYLVLWSGFLGAALATSDDRHISIDALTKYVPERGRHGVKVITSLFAAVTCYYLSQASVLFLVGEKEAGSVLFLSIPTWVGLAIIPAGYALLAIHFLVLAAENSSAVIRGEKGNR
jgi:TRAP-type C4-dicarboxylate transport system permease small subunit